MKNKSLICCVALAATLVGCSGGQPIQITQEAANSRLHSAVMNCSDGGVNRWINQGANPNMRFTDGGSLLMIAIARVGRSGCYDTVRQLIRHGTDVNTADDDGGTALMSAAYHGWDGALDLLLDAGANVNAVEEDGYTALMYAAQQGEKTTVNRLLNAHADASIVNHNGNTALDIALRNQHTETVIMFQKHGISQ